jgi:hypothetical protein
VRVVREDSRVQPGISEVVDDAGLVGFWASGSIPLLRSDLAHKVVRDYLQWA